MRGQQHSFSTHERMFLWKCQSFWDRKCLDLRGIRTPNLRIHAECSNHLSYQGQTFAVPCFEDGLWRYRYFGIKAWIRHYIVGKELDVFTHPWNNFNSDLTLNVRGPSYLGLTRSISWLLMPWLFTSPGHQQPWYWLCRICWPWSYMRNDFRHLCLINGELWQKV